MDDMEKTRVDGSDGDDPHPTPRKGSAEGDKNADANIYEGLKKMAVKKEVHGEKTVITKQALMELFRNIIREHGGKTNQEQMERIGELEAERMMTQQKLESAKSNLDAEREKATAVAAERDKLLQQLNALKGEWDQKSAAMTAERDQLLQQVNALKSDTEKAQLMDEARRAKDHAMLLEQEINKLEKTLAERDKDLSSVKGRLGSLEADAAKGADEKLRRIHELEQQVTLLKEQLATARAELRYASLVEEFDYNALLDRVRTLQKSASDEDKARLTHLQEALTDHQARYKNLVETMHKKHGTIQVLADLKSITAVDDEFRREMG